MNARLLASMMLVSLSALGVEVGAQDPSGVAPPNEVPRGGADVRGFDPVARIALVRGRDGRGRIETFLDGGNREFAVGYDANGRVSSSLATRGEHISDVRFIGYDDDGRIRVAELGGGLTLIYQYVTGGRQLIRDRFGGVISRVGSLEAGYRVLEMSDPTGRLERAVAGLDQLQLAAAAAR